MHETDTPHTTDPERDAVLDGFETDLDNVASALDALDADDLDGAEALVAGLGDSDAVDAAPASADESQQ